MNPRATRRKADGVRAQTELMQARADYESARKNREFRQRYGDRPPAPQALARQSAPRPEPRPLPHVPIALHTAVAFYRSLGYRVEQGNAHGVTMALPGPHVWRVALRVLWHVAYARRDTALGAALIRYQVARQPVVYLPAPII